MPSPEELLLPEFPNTQKFFQLGIAKSPGVCTIKGLGSKRKWEVRAGYGLSGASTVFTGNEVPDFTIDIYMRTRFEYLDWTLQFVPFLIKAIPGLRPVALGIKHPMINAQPWNISQVVVTDVSQFTQDEYGGQTVTISFLEWRKPLPALGKPLVAIPAAGKPVPTAQDAADKEIEAKLAVLKGLAGTP